ncbi:hypothetical protein HYW76_01950 [Candidatus Pacearchaeota archaeon]|nr:hypothetical protein [Candidatus Pacearchaeota archaeon]
MDKKSVRLIFSLMLAFAVFSSSVLAYSTIISVTTFPQHDIEVKVVDASESGDTILEIFNGSTGTSGKISFTHVSSETPISIIVMLWKDGKLAKANGKVVNRYENKQAGTTIELDLTSALALEETSQNLTIVNSTNTSESDLTNTAEIVNTSVAEVASVPASVPVEQVAAENSSDNSGESVISGNTLKTIKEYIPKPIYIIVTIIVIAVIIAGLFGFRALSSKMQFSSPNQEINVVKFSELKGKISPVEKSDKSLLAAERKLKEAQDELLRIENRKRKIEDLEKQFEDTRKELDRLKRN